MFSAYLKNIHKVGKEEFCAPLQYIHHNVLQNSKGFLEKVKC